MRCTKSSRHCSWQAVSCNCTAMYSVQMCRLVAVTLCPILDRGAG